MSWKAVNDIMPIAWPALAATGVLVAGGRSARGPAPIAPALALLGVALSFIWIWGFWPLEEPRSLFEGAVLLDNLGLFLGALATFCAGATILVSKDYLKRYDKNHAEYYALVAFALSGMILMVMSTNLISILFGIEIMSVSLYVLCGFFREDKRSVEASIKYFLTGSFATGLFLFGMANIFGATGSLDIADIGRALSGEHPSPLIWLGTGFMLGGFAFKVAAVPFHQWLPDVYEGAPTVVTGYMATGVKIAAFGTMIRLFTEIYHQGAALREVLWWIAVLTMTVGNVAALAQQSVKRMLAYSSIAHAGYILVGLVVMSGTGLGADKAIVATDGSRGILYYVMAYAMTNIGAFAILAFFERQDGGGVSFDDLAGLRQRFPRASLALTVFMLSLAGIPGTAGFIGKYLIFGAALEAGSKVSRDSFVVLAILGILNSLVGLYYYLRVPIQLYVKPLPDEGKRFPGMPAGVALTFVVFLATAGTLWFGCGPAIFGTGVEPALSMVAAALKSLR